MLGITKADQVQSSPLRGELFENFIVCEFLKNRFNHVKNNNLYFFRDHVGNEVDLILDDGNTVTSVEIKSGATISQDYFKGVDFYKKLSGEKNARKIIIYSGNQQVRYHDTDIYPYYQLPEIFKTS